MKVIQGWIGFTLLSEMPSYLTDELGFDLSSAGLLCVLPYAMMFCAVMGSGKLFTYLQQEKNWTVRDVRLTAQYASFLCAGGGLVLCGYIDYVPVAFTFMVISQAMLGVATSGFSCSFLDIAPNHSALLNSIANTIGAVAGIVGPIVVGLFTTAYPGSYGWRCVFVLSCCQCLVALALWQKYQRSEILPEINTPYSNSSLLQNNSLKKTVV